MDEYVLNGVLECVASKDTVDGFLWGFVWFLWACAAKVFVGYMTLGYLPIKLSHVFLHTVLSDEELDNKG